MTNNDDIVMQLITLRQTWKYRQTCLNQGEMNSISKAKAHIYGICAEEVKAMMVKISSGKGNKHE